MAKRRVISSLIAVVLIFAALTGTVFAQPEEFDDSNIKVKAAALVDAATGHVFYSKDADVKIYPASTTKILTCILGIENGDLEKEVEITKDAFWKVGSASSKMGLIEGEKVKFIDLLYGLMLPSGNDAANAIAVEIGGSIEGFQKMMNDKAAELGMTDTHFVVPSGIQDEEHYTTANDMIKATMYALKNETFRKITSTKTYTLPPTNKHEEPRELWNSNKLIQQTEKPDEDGKADPNPYYYEYATGVKTGDTTTAGRCLVATAKKNDTELLCLIYGDMTNAGNERWKIAKDLFEYGFNNFKTADLTSFIDSADPVKVQISNAPGTDPGGGFLELTPTVGSDGVMSYTGTADEVDKITSDQMTVEQVLETPLLAPITKGQICGRLDYKLDGQTLFSVNLIASRDVPLVASSQSEGPGPISELEPISPEELSGDKISPWWWLLIPAALIIALIVRIIYVSRKRKKRFKSRRRSQRSSYANTRPRYR